MPLDFAAAICESEAAPDGGLEVFFIEPPAEVELEAEVAGAAGVLAAGAELDIGAVALALAPEALVLFAGVFELSAAAAPDSIMLELSVLFFLLLLAPVVLVLADSLEASPEDAALVSDFLLFLLLLVALALADSLEASPEDATFVSDFLFFLLLLFEELLLAVSELAELSDVAESDFFDFVLFFDEVESPAELVLLVALSELDFFFDFLLLVAAVLWSEDVPDWASWDWAMETVTDNVSNRHIPAAHAANFREKCFIDIEPTFRSARLDPPQKWRGIAYNNVTVRSSCSPLRSQTSSSPPSHLSTGRRTNVAAICEAPFLAARKSSALIVMAEALKVCQGAGSTQGPAFQALDSMTPEMSLWCCATTHPVANAVAGVLFRSRLAAIVADSLSG